MEENASTARVALKFGVLGAVVIMVYTTILNVFGLSFNKGLGFVSYLFLIPAIILALNDFRQQNKGFIAYGEGLGLGSLLSAVLGLLVSMFGMFYTRFIDPTILTQAVDKARRDMEASGMDDAQIETNIEIAGKFMTPGFVFLGTVFMFLLIGFIFSLIISAIMRKEKPIFE